MQALVHAQGFLRRAALSLCVFVALGAGSLAAEAAVINYRFTLTVSAIGACNPGPWFMPDFGCDIDTGDSFTGRFQIEQELSGAPDGLYDVPFKSMYLRTGDVEWDHGKMPGDCTSIDPNCLVGYRNAISGFSVTGTGFFVKNGEIAGFSGGFFEFGDSSFIDFDNLYGLGAGQFGARAMSGQSMFGTYSIRRVPAPSPAALLLSGAVFAVLRRRRHGTSG